MAALLRLRLAVFIFFAVDVRGNTSVSFAKNFGSGIVLQRQPALASFYGFAPASSAVTLTLRDANGGGTTKETIETTASAEGHWKATLTKAYAAGGNYTATASGSGGSLTVLDDMTFGDVWYCSGQSNMELSLKFTFERNNTVAKILNGTYDNIRVFLNPHVTMPSPMWVDDGMHVAAKSSSSGPLEYQWRHLNELVNATDVQGSDIMPFSAACLYMGTGLTDLMHAAEQPEKRGAAAAVIPLGMMGVSWGGTLIEQWTHLPHQLACANVSCMGCNASTVVPPATACPHELPSDAKDAKECTGNGALFNGMTAPFANMSVKGFVWYQGENNCGGQAGNVEQSTGYACMLSQMANGWVDLFSSSTRGGTSSTAPFGVVTLADGGWEGNPANAGKIHWAETLNYGTLPSPRLRNGFVATAHDIGDPWNEQGCRAKGCCRDDVPPNLTAGCLSAAEPIPYALAEARYDDKTHSWVNGKPPLWPSTPGLMSSVHPRTKKYVGDRLAAAAWYGDAYGHMDKPAVGPVLSGCTLSGSTITLTFNTTLLRGETVVMKPWNATMRASATQVLVNKPFPRAEETANFHLGPKVMDYPPWTYAPIAAGAAGSNTIVVDVSAFGDSPEAIAAAVTGVRYARWARVDHPVCCGDLDFSLEPCPPNSCPISSSKSDLPAMPFEAEIVGGKCKCLAPQVCDA